MLPRLPLAGLIFCGLACPLARPLAAAERADFVIDAAHPGPAVSPTFYGLMTEEINHAYEGGLYAELVRNRSLGEDALIWYPVQAGGLAAHLRVDPSTPLNAELNRSLRLEATGAGEGSAGAANGGFWGIAVRGGETYHLSFYAKEPAGGALEADLESGDGRRVFARARFALGGAGWRQYRADLVPRQSAPDTKNRLVLRLTRPGVVWLQLVSLFPPTYHNRPNGNRIDLMEKMAALHPAFLRFPGGNYLEGNSLAERFNWKRTIGDLAHRPGHRSPWGYWSTDGLGLLEYLEWCEDLGMQPVLAVFAGYTLDGHHVPPGADLQPYVQDALEEIEYVSGGVATRWGAERARDGHPAPFPLRYVEIGNEDFFDKSGSYEGRFAQFFDAIKARYPRLQVIATTPVSSRRPDVLDDHYYESAARFRALAHRYDSYDRSGPKIFVGEWATRESPPSPHFDPLAGIPNATAALSDFVWMTAMERNADLIVMNAYAPLQMNVNPGAFQWRPDLILYNAARSWGTPSYAAQVKFNSGRGAQLARVTAPPAQPGLFWSATQSPDRIWLKLANTTAAPLDVHVAIVGREAAPRPDFRLDAYSDTVVVFNLH